MLLFYQGDATCVQADAIVVASNSVGYMGGLLGRIAKLTGHTERLHYHSQGVIEDEARRMAALVKPQPGDVFITGAANLKCKYIIHAVISRFPGDDPSLRNIERCLDRIIRTATELNLRSVALPVLGSGGKDAADDEIADLYGRYLLDTPIRFTIVNPGIDEELFLQNKSRR